MYIEKNKNLDVVEIYWSDLTEEAQKQFLEYSGGDNGNYDVYPIATIEYEHDDLYEP